MSKDDYNPNSTSPPEEESAPQYVHPVFPAVSEEPVDPLMTGFPSSSNSGGEKAVASVLKLLKEVEDLLENTKRGPFSSLFGFDEDAFHTLFIKIRSSLPEDLKRAHKMAREAERNVIDSRVHCDRILGEAQRNAKSETDRSRAEAAATRKSADEYALKTRSEADAEVKSARQALSKEVEQTRLDLKADVQKRHVELDRQIATLQETSENEAHQLIERARLNGIEIVDSAKVQANQAVATSEILKRAEAEAKILKAQTDAHVNAIRRGADDYARDVLSHLEGVLEKAATQVRHGRETLKRE